MAASVSACIGGAREGESGGGRAKESEYGAYRTVNAKA